MIVSDRGPMLNHGKKATFFVRFYPDRIDVGGGHYRPIGRHFGSEICQFGHQVPRGVSSGKIGRGAVRHHAVLRRHGWSKPHRGRQQHPHQPPGFRNGPRAQISRRNPPGDHSDGPVPRRRRSILGFGHRGLAAQSRGTGELLLPRRFFFGPDDVYSLHPHRFPGADLEPILTPRSLGGWFQRNHDLYHLQKREKGGIIRA